MIYKTTCEITQVHFGVTETINYTWSVAMFAAGTNQRCAYDSNPPHTHTLTHILTRSHSRALSPAPTRCHSRLSPCSYTLPCTSSYLLPLLPAPAHTPALTHSHPSYSYCFCLYPNAIFKTWTRTRIKHFLKMNARR